MTVAIIKMTPAGRRAFPLTLAEAEALVEKGKATRLNKALFSEVAGVPGAAPDEKSDEYQTKVMVAETPRRGRPRKETQQ